MGRPPSPQVKDMFKYVMRKSHAIMGTSHGVAPKVNIGESTCITFGATPWLGARLGDLPISYPMKIQGKNMRSFIRRNTTSLDVAFKTQTMRV